MSERDPKAIVRLGYDSASLRYRRDDDFPDRYKPWIEHLVRSMPRDGHLLDLGCGCGVPVAREVARTGISVTGIDISEVQIARARQLVPDGTFFVADFSEIAFPENSFDAICSFYALIHLPQDEQRHVIKRIGRWLTPGGQFLATVGHEAWTGEQAGWLSGTAAMWWSHPDDATYRSWIESAGMQIDDQQFVADGRSGHMLFAARRPL